MRLTLAGLAGVMTFIAFGRAHCVSIPVPSGRLLAIASVTFGMLLVLGMPPAPVSLALTGSALVTILVRRWAMRRAADEAVQRWPDFLALVRGRIAAGEPLPDAVGAAARSLGPPFVELDRRWGDSFAERLETVRSAWADPVADRVLTTLRVAAITGGAHVDAILSALATSLADEIRLRRSHEAALTQQQMTAGVALVSPWIILGLSLTTNPQAGAAFATSTGRSIIVLGAVASVIGYALARRASRLSAPPRVFR